MPTKSYEFSNFKCKSFVEKQYPQEFKIAAVKNGEMRRIVACMGEKQTKYYDKKEEQPAMPSWVEEDGSMKEYSTFTKD